MAIENFIPEIWHAQLLVSLKKEHVYGQAGIVNRNYEGDISAYGDTVHIVGIERPTVGDYVAHTDIAFEQVDDNLRTLVIDQSKYFAFEIDDIEARQQRNGTMGEAASEAAYELSDISDRYIAAQMKAGVDAANKLPAITIGGTDMSADGDALRGTFVDLRTRLNRSNVPTQGRFAIVSPEIYAVLLRDPQFIRAEQYGSSRVLLNAEVGQLYGFSIIESNNVPDVGGVHTLIAGTSLGFSFAEQISKVEAVRLEKRFADGLKGLHVYGSKMVRPEAVASVDVTVPA